MKMAKQQPPNQSQAKSYSQLPQYRFNKSSQRYINADTGRFVSRTEILNVTEQVIDGAKGEIKDLAKQYQSGEIGLKQWQSQMAQAIKDLHVATAVSAKGGFAQMSKSDYGYVGNLVKQQYQYLKEFAKDVAEGKQKADGQGFLNRAGMYANASRSTYFNVQGKANGEAGFDQERRILHSRTEDCGDCKTYAALGWQPIGSLPEIGDSQCQTNCRCEFDYRHSTAEMSKAGNMSELSFNEIRGMLEQALNAGSIATGLEKGVWVIDVYSNWFVYQDYSSSGTFKRDYSIGTDGKVTLGDAVKVVETKVYTTVQTAAFDLNGDYQETDDEIIVEGLIFKAGEYKDKNYSMTPAEILTAVEKFTGADVDDSHNERSIFKGKMGRVREVYSPDNGETLWGKVGIKKWVDNAMGDLKRTVSCTWDRTTKTLAGLALTTTPRIEEAILFAAFIADQEEKTKEGAEFEGKRNSTADHKTIQSIHDHCMSLGANCSGANAEYSNPQNQNKELPKMSDENKVEFKDSPEYQAMKAQFDAQASEIERMKADKRHNDAVQAVEELLRTGKAVPAERAALVAAFEIAATDDAKNPMKVTFGEGQEGSRVDALKAVYAARPAHVLFGEQVPVGGDVLFSHRQAKDENEVSEARHKELLSLSMAGRAVLDGGGK